MRISDWSSDVGASYLYPRFLRIALWILPLPWLAIESGWFVAEFGRQPWVIEGVLPTYYAASGLTVTDLVIRLSIFLVLYTGLAIVGGKVMLRAIKAGSHEPAGPGGSAPGLSVDPSEAGHRASLGDEWENII